jgi:predicted Zn-dependent protease
LTVVDNSTVNAFAAPGGQVVILRGLLEQTTSAEQLAGVVAHELQHVYLRHSTRAILEQTAGTLLLTAVSGDLSG